MSNTAQVEELTAIPPKLSTDWTLAKTLFCRGLHPKDIAAAVGCNLPALYQQKKRHKWDDLKTRVAILSLNNQDIIKSAEMDLANANARSGRSADEDIEVWSDRMRGQIMRRVEMIIARLPESDAKTLDLLGKVADMVRKLSFVGRSEAIAPSKIVDFTLVRDGGLIRADAPDSKS